MILCVYHGSSFKDVNESQTANITNAIKESFPTHDVIDCYYSTHVLEVMKRRNTPLYSFEEALKDNLENEQIYVLITNMMNGFEYQNILKTIEKYNSKNTIQHTKYLLDKSNLYSLAEAVVDRNNSTLFIGHGNDLNNSDYQFLNDILSEDNNFVTTLHSDIEKVCDNFYNRNIIVKPLMITSAYHANRDISVTVKSKLENLGYTPKINLDPLALNKQIINLLIHNLNELI